MRREGSEVARSPREVRRDEVQEIAKRGVRIGWTRGKEATEEGVWYVDVRVRMWEISVLVAVMEASTEGSM